MSDLTPQGSAAVRLAQRAATLRAERDRARSIAMSLEEEVAILTTALHVALDAPSDGEAIEGCRAVLRDSATHWGWTR